MKPRFLLQGCGCVAWLLAGLFSVQGSDPNLTALVAGFGDPPPATRTRMFWRVFGPAWAPEEIDYQLALLKEAGVGGVTLFCTYPVEVDNGELHNQRFLSDEFLRTLNYAARKAAALKLRFSIAGGTGWPFGGPTVGISDAAQQIRQIKLAASKASGTIALPTLREGERVVAAFIGTNDSTARLVGNELNLTGLVVGGPPVVYVAGPTYMRVKRPALGAEGFVLDHYESGAAGRYLAQVVEPLLRAAPGRIESIFCDSLEVYGANWTSDLPTEFQRRRGYALLPVLPDLFNADSPFARERRFDFWRTLAELTEARFTRFVGEWAHHHGVRFEMEVYGTPPNPLTAARYLDVPTGEQYEWKGFSLSRLAASGAHLAGKRIIGAEAWTWLGLPNRLGDSLSDLKLASDFHFLAGVNDLTGVDFAYSPRSAGAPGWLPYYGPVLNQNNPQWPWFRCLVDYTSRCQWLLRQGKPVAKIALYLPVEDIFASGPVDQMLLGFHLRDHFVSGEKTDEFGLKTARRHRSDLIQSLLTQGFSYDGLDFFSVDRLARVSRGRLIAGDGDYGLVVLPRLVGIEIEALDRMVAFARSGGAVIITGRLPGRTYGSTGPGAVARSKVLLTELLGAAPGTNQSWTKECGRGRVTFVPDEDESLGKALQAFSPDVRLEPPQQEIGFVHRQAGALDLYFLANAGDQPRAFTADFSAGGGDPELWDPLSGKINRVDGRRTADHFQRISLELPPRGSIFVVFGARSTPRTNPPASFTSKDLSPEWTLAFAGTNAPKPRGLTELVSWTTWPDARFFSGIGTYTATFVWSHPVPRQAWLNLARVREVADVRINGHAAGAVWMPPYETEITPWLQTGTNSISISVANVPLNLFLGTPDEDLGALRRAYGDRFPAPEEKRVVREPAPSGLLGPVKIRFQPL